MDLDGVSEDARITDARVLLVCRAVHVLDVEEDVVEAFDDVTDRVKIKITAGLDPHIDAGIIHVAYEHTQKFLLQERFAAGESDAAARKAEEKCVALDASEDLHRVVFDTGDLESFDGAHLRADTADIAVHAWPRHRRRGQVLWAGCGTFTATYALVLMVDELGGHRLRFGVGAPLASERAARQEYRRSDAVSVVNGVVLHLHQDPFTRTIHVLSHLRSFVWLYGFVCRSRDNGLLHFGRKVDKLRAVACDAHQQVLVILRMFLCLAQHLVRQRVELYVEGAEREVGTDDIAEVSLTLLCLDEVLAQA